RRGAAAAGARAAEAQPVRSGGPSVRGNRGTGEGNRRQTLAAPKSDRKGRGHERSRQSGTGGTFAPRGPGGHVGAELADRTCDRTPRDRRGAAHWWSTKRGNLTRMGRVPVLRR